MRSIEELTLQVLKHEDVPAPEVVTVVPQVRTNIIVPIPAWSRPSDEDPTTSET